MNRKVNKKKIAMAAILFFFGAYVVCGILYGTIVNNQIELKEKQAVSDIESQGSRVKYIMENTLHKLDTLDVFVHLSGGNIEHFGAMAELILQDEQVRNIALAPDGVIQNIYPMYGNDAAIGLNLLGEENASAQEAQLAVDTKSLTIAGPYELKQGGMGVSGRLAVFLPDEDGRSQFWGLVTLTLDLDQMLEVINMESLEADGYRYELWRVNPKDQSHQTIACSQKSVKEDEDYVEVELRILNDTWYLRAIPISGWISMNNILLFFILFTLFDALISIQIYLLLYIQDEWKAKASLDALTNLYNRSYLETHEKNILSKAGNTIYAYMMIDADDFKTVNDTMGHGIGDEVLILIANALVQQGGGDAIASRPGGDEFSLLLPCVNRQQAEKVADDICHSVKRKVEKEGKVVDVSCSIGIAFYPEDADNFKELKTKADKALYYCKNHRKGTWHLYGADCELTDL